MLKLLMFSLIVAGGQLVFKHVAQRLGDLSGIGPVIRQLAFDPWFIGALALYGVGTLLWILALRETPLSKAYVFVALAFALVPLGATIFFSESLGPRYYLGLLLVIAGVTVIGSSAKSPVKSAEVGHAVV
jgi:drug/metabolite transporter (DMT)-like permease